MHAIIQMSLIWSHALLSSKPYGVSVPIVAALSFVALAVAYRLRQRWWEKADLPHWMWRTRRAAPDVSRWA